MIITFNSMFCGLGNNGGSLTIAKSANALTDLGHKVYIIDTISNQLTWLKLNCRHLVIKRFEEVPTSNILIATGFGTVKSTIQIPDRCGIKYHWIRAWETWKMSENSIVENVLKQGTIKLVNSICLQDKLKEYNCNSYIVRPGYDFDLINPLNIRKNNKSVVLGGLYNTKERKRFEWIIETVSQLKKRFNIKLHLFGDERYKGLPIVDKYLRSPNNQDKNTFYNEVDIWLAPTKSEGLHMPPAESMITECCVVGTSAKMSGMQDYLINNETGLVSEDNLQDFKNCVIKVIENKELREQLGKKGREKVLQLGDRRENMNKMIDLFKELEKNQNL